MTKLLKYAVVTLAVGTVFANEAHAQSIGAIDDIIGKFQGQAQIWQNTLMAFAEHTFAILAAIEITWSAIKLVFNKADVGDWLAEILNQLLGIGFFWLLLQNAATWGNIIVDSFRMAGKSAGGVGISPADVFAAGVALAQKVLGRISVWHPESSVSLMIAALVVCAAYALIAAEMFITIIQSYICIYAGIINMAFGGSQWTRDIALSTIKYDVSIGAKLMILQLIVSVGQGIMIEWAVQFNDMTNASLMELVGCSIIMFYLVKILPNEFQRIVGGSSLSSGSGLIGAGMEVAAAGAAIAGGTASIAANTAGVGATTWQAGSLASSQSAAGSGSFAGNMARNLGGAAINEAGRRLRGDVNSQHGYGSWRMASELSANRRRYLRDIEREKEMPKPPENSISS